MAAHSSILAWEMSGHSNLEGEVHGILKSQIQPSIQIVYL